MANTQSYPPAPACGHVSRAIQKHISLSLTSQKNSYETGIETQQVWKDASILLSEKKRLRIGGILTQFTVWHVIEVPEQVAEALLCESFLEQEK